MKAELRIRDFSSGMKNLGDESRNYIHRLTNDLFFIEQIYPSAGEASNKRKRSIKMRKKQMLRAVQSLILAVVVIFGAVIVSCKDESDTPQTKTVTFTVAEHGFNGSAELIPGNDITAADWTNIETTIKNAVEQAHTLDVIVGAVFGQSGGVTVTVDKTASYPNWQATAVNKISIKLSSITAPNILNAINAVGSGTGRVIPSSHNGIYVVTVNADTPAVTKGANS